MIVKTKNSSDFDVMALSAQYLPGDNDGVEAKSDENKGSKNEHVTYRRFKTILDIQYIFRQTRV
jgi:hypothetical protein